MCVTQKTERSQLGGRLSRPRPTRERGKEGEMGDVMRRVHLQLSDSQRQRLLDAQQRFAHLAGSVHSSALVNVGDTIPVDYDSGFLRGHGTQLVDGKLLATVCGVIERVNKLVSVRPLRARYNAETGDVVVGRVTEVAPKRWKVDVNSRQDAQLMLSSVNLPGGIQRRRTSVDELTMRDLYTEHDLISAEVQSLHHDGSLHLHTRSLKYGKLENGQLVKVAPYLIKRLKQHFHQLKEYGVQLILGCNGYVWVSGIPPSNPDAAANESSRIAYLKSQDAEKLVMIQSFEVSLEVRQGICRLANIIRALGAVGVMIHPGSIVDAYEASLSSGTEIRDIVSAEFYVKLLENEAERRAKKGIDY